jgi:hypothetical protein
MQRLACELASLSAETPDGRTGVGFSRIPTL